MLAVDLARALNCRQMGFDVNMLAPHARQLGQRTARVRARWSLWAHKKQPATLSWELKWPRRGARNKGELTTHITGWPIGPAHDAGTRARGGSLL
jgi:hypothetical protein